MAWRRPEVVKACRLRKKARARAFVDALRARTFCVRCGRQPIEWHNKEHEQDKKQRISNMVGRGITPARIQTEIDKCTPYCRSCHMAVDGRTRNLVDAFQDWRMSLPAEERRERARRASRARIAKLPPKAPKAKPFRVPRIPFPDVLTGRRPRESYVNSKLDPVDVLAIRRDYRHGSGPDLAAKYGVTRNLISKIVRRQCWKSVEAADQ